MNCQHGYYIYPITGEILGIGTVADHSADLFDDIRNSYGIGFRMILSGVIIRFDYSGGEEGPQSQLFITYPWSMFSVDDPA